MVYEDAECTRLLGLYLDFVKYVFGVEAAYPAKPIFANIACHFRAPLILLNQRMALRTWTEFNSPQILGPLLQLVVILARTVLAMVLVTAISTDLGVAEIALY